MFDCFNLQYIHLQDFKYYVSMHVSIVLLAVSGLVVLCNQDLKNDLKESWLVFNKGFLHGS